MDPVSPPKKGLGTLAWLGIGCGALIVLVAICGVVGFLAFAPKLKKIGEDMQKDPTRTMATTMANVSMGQLEIVASDEANKRYTLKDKNSGKLTTIYWDARTKTPKPIAGDFSAIPADANPPGTPATPATPAPN